MAVVAERVSRTYFDPLFHGGLWFDYRPGEQLVGVLYRNDAIRWHRASKPNACIYQENIRPVHLSDQNFSDEETVSATNLEQHRNHVRLREGDSAKETLEYTFQDIQTLEQSTKLNFQSEIQAKLGSLYSPASGYVDQKVEKEYADKFGNQKTYSQTEEYELDIQGPANLDIVFERSKQKAQRHTTCRPIFDYGIRFLAQYNDGGFDVIDWHDKAEFLAFVQGQSPDSVGVMHSADRPLKGGGFFDLGFDSTVQNTSQTVLAPFFRAHAQPNAEIEGGSALLAWTENYDNVIAQGVEEEEVGK